MQYQKPVLIQEQKMKLSPQMFQSIQLMALPVQDLKFRIQEEVDRNPALEIKDQKKEISIDEVSSSRREDYDYFENSSDPGFFSSASPDSSVYSLSEKIFSGQGNFLYRILMKTVFL